MFNRIADGVEALLRDKQMFLGVIKTAGNLLLRFVIFVYLHDQFRSCMVVLLQMLPSILILGKFGSF
jgi:hypothetical protein